MAGATGGGTSLGWVAWLLALFVAAGVAGLLAWLFWARRNRAQAEPAPETVPANEAT
jgi:hypothetical protein